MRNGENILPEERDEHSQHLLENLRQAYRPEFQDARACTRIRERLLMQHAQRHAAHHTAVSQEEQRQSFSPQKTRHGGFSPMKNTSSSNSGLTTFGRRVSLLVAVLMVTLLVGSLVVVLNLTHHPGTGVARAGATPTPFPSPTTQPTVTMNPNLPAHEGQIVYSTPASSFGYYALAWSPDSQRVAAGNHSVQIWDATTGKHSLTIPGNDEPVSLAWSPNGHYLAVGGTTVRIIDPHTGALVRAFSSAISFARPSTSSSVAPMTSFSGGGISVSSTPWSPDGSLIASSIGNIVVVWNPSSGAVVYTFRGQSSEVVMSVAWSPDGTYIASTTLDTVQVWNAHTGQVIFTHRISTSSSASPYAYTMFAHHSMTLAFISDSHTIEVWNVATNTKVASYGTSTVQSGQFAWSPNDSEIASINGRNVDIWGANTGAMMYRFTRQGDTMNALAWSPDGTYIVSGSGSIGSSGYARVWIA